MHQKYFSKLFFGIALIILTTGFSFRCNQLQPSQLPQVNLEYWRVFEGRDVLDDLINAYTASHPNITVTVKKFRYDEYEAQLVNAFAEDRAPDLFSIPNTWIRRYAQRITPLPPAVVLPTYSIQGTIKKEVAITIETTPTITPAQIEQTFVDAVANDVVEGDQILGLPLALDTLVLFYNKDLLAQSSIAEPPTTWKQVQEMTPKLTKQNARGEFLQSAIALGSTENVPRSFDIVSLLMLQNGTVMASRNGAPLFDQLPPNASGDVFPGPQALQFYTDFATPSKITYTWNATQSPALELFIQGRLAMMLGYSYQYAALKSAQPQFNWDVASVPQVDPTIRVEYANYWVETVSKRTRYPNEAWGLIAYMASPGRVEYYLNKTGKPTALRSLVKEGSKRPRPLNIFNDAVLTAKSWYKGENPLAAERIFQTMVTRVVDEGMDIPLALKQAARQINDALKMERP